MASIKDLKRMCIAYDECKDCPLSTACSGYAAPNTIQDNADEIVDKWIQEHPARTYAMDFFEKFPKAPKDPSVCLMPCIRLIYPEAMYKSCLEYTCKDCWNQPIPEDK